MTNESKSSYLTSSQCLAVVKSMASSSGFYSRLYTEINNDPSAREEFFAFCEHSKFTDPVDLCIGLEDGLLI